MLAREASHRVKNNLGIIVALIGMERGMLRDGQSRESLEALEAVC